jgi:signal transduction histidine kinase
MRLSSRFLLAIIPFVVLASIGIVVGLERERARILEPEVREQTRAYARALDIAFEYALGAVETARVQRLLDRIAANDRVVGVRVYSADGSLRYASVGMRNASILPDTVLRAVLAGRDEFMLDQVLGGEPTSTVVRAIREPPSVGAAAAPSGRVLGALEVAQPYSVLITPITRVEREEQFVSFLLFLLLAVLIAGLTRFFVERPLSRLVAATRALGRGETNSRVPTHLGSVEIDALSEAFNDMAARLDVARARLFDEADARVQLERRLVEAEKLASMGTLAAGLAHEIGAPLNVIAARSELLLQRGDLPVDSRRQLESIVSQSSRITRTVRSLLDYARRPARRHDAVALAEVIRHTLDALEPELERAGVTVTAPVEALVVVDGDSEQLQQALANLVLNAVQAMDGQTRPRHVRIGVARVATATPTPMAAIAVTDSGPGLPGALDGRLFTPFATTKAAGTGLGLVVARSIVEDHGGSLVGTSRSDGEPGATFLMTLPIRVEAREPSLMRADLRSAFVAPSGARELERA